MTISRTDESFMRETLRLAEKGAGLTNPNPMVGAILVRAGRVIARGYHHAAGKPHAEIEALLAAGGRANGATLYVNLEPCRHSGRTPPCVDVIIRAGISRVVCAARDPNPVARGGADKLRRAGINVSIGVLSKEARDLNETFFTFHEKKRPFVALKFAASLDGKLATYARDAKWITNEKARAYARRLRGTYQAIVVGIETVIADNPNLGARTKGMHDPLRIILDSRLRIPLTAHVLRDTNVLIATTRRASKRKIALLEQRGIRVYTFKDTRISPRHLLATLRKMNITSVLVEGGGGILGSFIDAEMVDKVYAFYAPILIGGKKAITIGGSGTRYITDAIRFRELSLCRFGDNLLIIGRV